MRLAKLKASRLTLLVVGFVWLPYVAVTCVASPFETMTQAPKCHKMATVYADQADSEGNLPKGLPTSGTCCDITGKANVAVEKAAEAAPPELVFLAALVYPVRAAAQASSAMAEDLSTDGDSGPPLYLGQLRFLL